MKPTIGRIVHYKSCSGHEWPAIVTFVHRDGILADNGVVTLCVILDSGFSFKGAVLKGNEKGQWHWPEKEDARTDKVLPMGVEEAEGK